MGPGCSAPGLSHLPSGTCGLAGACSHDHCRSERGLSQLCKPILSHCSFSVYTTLATANHTVKNKVIFYEKNWMAKGIYTEYRCRSGEKLSLIIYSSTCIIGLERQQKANKHFNFHVISSSWCWENISENIYHGTLIPEDRTKCSTIKKGWVRFYGRISMGNTELHLSGFCCVSGSTFRAFDLLTCIMNMLKGDIVCSFSKTYHQSMKFSF